MTTCPAPSITVVPSNDTVGIFISVRLFVVRQSHLFCRPKCRDWPPSSRVEPKCSEQVSVVGIFFWGKERFSCVLSSEEKRISRERKESGPGQDEVSVQSLRGQHCHLSVAWPRSRAGVTSCVKERLSNQTGSPS